MLISHVFFDPSRTHPNRYSTSFFLTSIIPSCINGQWYKISLVCLYVGSALTAELFDIWASAKNGPRVLWWAWKSLHFAVFWDMLSGKNTYLKGTTWRARQRSGVFIWPIGSFRLISLIYYLTIPINQYWPIFRWNPIFDFEENVFINFICPWFCLLTLFSDSIMIHISVFFFNPKLAYIIAFGTV